MVTDSHHWFNGVGLFLLNFSRFSIFRREVRIRSVRDSAYCSVLATPSATSCTSSAGVNVGGGFLGVGRGDGVGGSGGDGGSDSGLEGGLPTPPAWGFLHSRGDACPVGIGGIAGCRSLLV